MKFTIMGEPRGKQRPRFNRKTGTTYTPSETVQYEKAVGFLYRRAHGEKLNGNVRLEVTAFYKIPTSMTKKAKAEMVTGQSLPAKKPDLDNVLKIVMDGLNGIAYSDDKQVVSVRACKLYSIEPRVEVEVSEL